MHTIIYHAQTRGWGTFLHEFLVEIESCLLLIDHHIVSPHGDVLQRVHHPDAELHMRTDTPDTQNGDDFGAGTK